MITVLKAPAKINICLKINGKTPDGYHDLTTIMQCISLYDILAVNIIRAKNGKTFEKDDQINLTCNFHYIPTDERNLIVKIIRYVFDKHDIHDRIDIKLKKMIPTGAGLGGGSSDAASMLLYLNKFYKLKYTINELVDIAVQFGSDIPFFLYRKESICRGRGEKVEPIHQYKGYYVLIATPDVRVSTRDIYEKYDLLDIPIGLGKVNDEKIEKILYAINKNDKDALASNMFNDLELVTCKVIEDINIFKQKIIECGAFVSMMSGSGPTVFGFFKDFISVTRCKNMLKKAYNSSFVFITKAI